MEIKLDPKGRATRREAEEKRKTKKTLRKQQGGNKSVVCVGGVFFLLLKSVVGGVFDLNLVGNQRKKDWSFEGGSSASAAPLQALISSVLVWVWQPPLPSLLERRNRPVFVVGNEKFVFFFFLNRVGGIVVGVGGENGGERVAG